MTDTPEPTSLTVDLSGPVHVMDHGGDGDPVILIHGLGGSHVNWISVADDLKRHGRVVCPDLIGFGLTPPRGRRTNLSTNADLIVDLIHWLGSRPALLVGNSMGGLLALLVAQANPELVRGIVLLDPALPMRRPNLDPRGLVQALGPHLPILALAAVRRTPFPANYMASALRLVVHDPESISDRALTAHLELAQRRMRMPWITNTFFEAGKSTVSQLFSRAKFTELVENIAAPVLLIHGRRDRVVPVSAARWVAGIRPDWRYEELVEIGHVPQLEAPRLVTTLVDDWMRSARRKRGHPGWRRAS